VTVLLKLHESIASLTGSASLKTPATSDHDTSSN